MTLEGWDADQAVMRGPIDAELEGVCAADRYGVIGREELAGEPLDVMVAQEDPEPAADLDVDNDDWFLVDDEWNRVADDDVLAPEERALHTLAV